MQLAPGLIISGKYCLEEPLSRGGMGSVWIARHVHLGSPIAIKFMDPGLAGTPAYRARFEREARAAAHLRSPHIVHVQDYGVEEDTPYIVMELLHGESLADRLQRCVRLPLADTARILIQLSKGLRRAHENGLVHRDLKPANLFLAAFEDDEILKILDFGIAKETTPLLSGDITQSGQVLGSPYYMSPEQIRGAKDLDHRSDIWAVGVIVFRMVTGQLPFQGQVMGEVLARIVAEAPPRATELAPDLPHTLDAFFEKALARNPADRYASVRDLVEAFLRIADVTAPSSITRLVDDRPSSAALLPAPAPHDTAPLPAADTEPLPPISTLPLSGQPSTDGAAAAATIHEIPESTLPTPFDSPTHAGVTGPGTTTVRRARRRWLLAAGAITALLLGSGLTAARLGTAPAVDEPHVAQASGTPSPDSAAMAPPTPDAPAVPMDTTLPAGAASSAADAASAPSSNAAAPSASAQAGAPPERPRSAPARPTIPGKSWGF